MGNMDLIELKPAIVAENSNGIYVTNCNYACTLLSCMNLIKEIGMMNPSLEEMMVNNFSELLE